MEPLRAILGSKNNTKERYRRLRIPKQGFKYSRSCSPKAIIQNMHPFIFNQESTYNLITIGKSILIDKKTNSTEIEDSEVIEVVEETANSPINIVKEVFSTNIL